MVISVPEIQEITIDAADEFIAIGSDGIFNAMGSQDVVNYIRGDMQQGRALEDIIARQLQSFTAIDTALGPACVVGRLASTAGFNFTCLQQKNLCRSEALHGECNQDLAPCERKGRSSQSQLSSTVKTDLLHLVVGV
eukprot:4747816-Amphidinium_carterae.1